MVKITDQDSLEKMAQVEGESWKVFTSTFNQADISAPRFCNILERFKSRKKWHADSCVGTIYGDGGWNRWHVYGDGEVVFSLHHGRKEDAEKAASLGFRTV